MARFRGLFVLAFLLGAPAVAPAAEAPVLVQYYQQERGYGGPQYGRPPPRRQVCRTEYRRVFAARDQWGRPHYRNVPRRVCYWR